MPAVPITVPGVGESISEGILSRWLKPDGSSVKVGDPLYELETDKASNVVPASTSGVLRIGVAEGTTVEIGASVGTIDPQGQPTASTSAPKSSSSPTPTLVSAPSVTKSSEPSPPQNGGSSSVTTASETLSPAVRRIVSEEKVDLTHVKGSGREERITKGDVLAHLATVPSLTPGGGSMASRPVINPPAPIPHVGSDRGPSGERESRKRMSGIRQKIAQRLVEAQQTAAILTTFNEADMTRVMDLRAKYKDAFKAKHGVALGFMSFFLKATIEALKAFPVLNGRVDGQDIVYHHTYDIGVAVSTERGLMVPVIREADALSFAGIEKAIAAYAAKARDNQIAVPDLQGGTFTITNGGVFGSLLSTPILNPPQSGILGMHTIQKRPVALDDQVVIRPMMYLAVSYDHRIVDGKEAVSFLMRIKECIENPERLLLEI
ncbi:MAG: 2-oxoglutarate dehydrogenase complex dihydrolipoyllysine-residue succinyltransferase [Isosphaeraceae bacterium]